MTQAIGGCKAAGANLHAQLPYTQSLLIDALREVEHREDELRDRSIRSITIGESQTTATLAQEIHGRDARTPGTVIPTHLGMGANPVIGAQAARLVYLGPEYARLMRDLRASVINMCGKMPSLIHWRHLSSICGGTGSGCLVEFTFNQAHAISRFGCAVVLDLDVVGAIGFAGLSPMAPRNAAATLLCLLAKTIFPDPRFPRVAIRLTLSELPPLGKDQQLRDQLILLEEQALASDEFRAESDRVVVNPGGDPAIFEDAKQAPANTIPAENLGVVLLRETNWTRFFDRYRVVLPAVCNHFYPQVEAVIAADAAVDRTMFVEELWTPKSHPLAREPVPSLVAQAKDVDFETFRDAVKLPPALIRYQLSLLTNCGGLFHVGQVESLFSAPPESFVSARERMGTLAVLDEVMRDFEMGAQNALGELNREIEQAEITLQARFRVLEKYSFRWGPAARQQRLLQAALILRKLTDERVEFTAKLREIERLIPLVKRERLKFRRQLDAIATMLSEWLPRHDQVAGNAYFEMIHDDEAFQVLFPLPTRSPNQQVDSLCALLKYLTLEGLQACLGSETADIPTLARMVVSSTPQFQSPPWGGQRLQTPSQQFFVLPRLEPEVTEKMRKAILTETKNAGVVVSVDSMAFGVGVLTIRIRQIERLREAIPPFYADEILQVARNPHREDFSIDFDESLQVLGIQVDHDLRIPNLPPNPSPVPATDPASTPPTNPPRRRPPFGDRPK